MSRMSTNNQLHGKIRFPSSWIESGTPCLTKPCGDGSFMSIISHVLVRSYNSGQYNTVQLPKPQEIPGEIQFLTTVIYCNNMNPSCSHRQDAWRARLPRLLQPRDQVDGQVVAAIHLQQKHGTMDLPNVASCGNFLSHGGTPKFIDELHTMEKPTKMDDLGVALF